jgi:IclR family pca regulon transcriptional regulator
VLAVEQAWVGVLWPIVAGVAGSEVRVSAGVLGVRVGVGAQRPGHGLTVDRAARVEDGGCFAVNDEELESALRSIAVPVRSRSGQVVAAVNIAIPWSPEAIIELVSRHGPVLQDTARQIAARVI